MIPFGEWLPDAPAFGQHATVAKNVIPGAASYMPFPSASEFSSALGAACVGAASTKAGDQDLNWAGTATKLYKLADGTYSDVSLAANYNLTAEERWSWATYGSRVIATSYKDYPQSYVVGTSTLFANLTTTLKARYVGVVREFVVFANTYDASDGAMPHQVWWSAINDPTDYTVDAATQCDKQQIYGEGDVGKITGFVGGEAGTIFMEGGVFRMSYVGAPVIFTVDQIVFGAGCVMPGSIASYGSMIFYLGPDGFYLLNGTSVIPIGNDKVNQWFYADLDSSSAYLCSSAIDPDNALYLLAYPGANNTGTCNKIIAYNWESQKWSVIEPGNVEVLVTALSEGINIDSATAATLYGNIDTGNFAKTPVDSPLFADAYLKPLQLACFNDAHKLAYFNSTPLTAVIETAENQLFPGERALVTNVRPMVENSDTVAVEIGTRDKTADAVSYSDSSSMNGYGECNVLANGRYQRARVTITGGFDHAYGIDIEAKRAGKY